MDSSTMTCPQCQAPIVETQRFCRFCGHRVGEDLQEYVTTKTFVPPTSPAASPHPTTSPMAPPVVNETLPLTTPIKVKSNRAWLVLGLLAAAVVGAFGAGAFFFWIQPDPPVGRIEGTIPQPPRPPEPPMAPHPELAPPPTPPTAPKPPKPARRPADVVAPTEISQLLREHAALLQEKIDILRKDLAMEDRMSPRRRMALLREMKQLQRDKLGVLMAAEAIKGQSEALRGLSEAPIAAESLVRIIEGELRAFQEPGRLPPVDLDHVPELSEIQKKRIEMSIRRALDRAQRLPRAETRKEHPR
jgi:hypothetical protein